MDLLAFGTPGPLELGIILAIILLIFGAGKLPKIGSQLGDALRGFKRGVSGVEDEGEVDVTVLEPPQKEVSVEVEIETEEEQA